MLYCQCLVSWTQVLEMQVKRSQYRHLRVALIIALMIFIAARSPAAAAQDQSAQQARPGKYFKIQVLDRQTGRGVPLVELRTTNNIRYFTDSSGIAAFYEPGLMDREVFFFVESHGHEFPKDGFGFRGTRLKTTPGASAVIHIDRLNIAERLYRVTGEGIYRDSVLTGTAVPLKKPVLNGQVMGQDSVFTCIYHGRLFWMWGDTGRPSYPLGNFAMSGAVSDLPDQGGLDPSVGVNLKYYVGEDGFSRKMSPLKEPGLVWLDGLITVRDPQGNQRMVAKFARLKGLGDVLERGLVVFNDAAETFEPLVRGGLEFLPYRNTGHAFAVEVDGLPYYYFTSPSPVGARLRIRARWQDVIDPNRYEALTAVATNPANNDDTRIDLGRSEPACRWVPFAELIASGDSTRAALIEALEQEAKDVRVYDVESGKAVIPHNGSVHFNAYRKRWIGIFVQQFGEPSNLGEVWYAEADTPVGPWAYARKIVTHNKYSFYNPMHHPYFDQDGGRVIFFEGTYSHSFSGSAENATPRYDYNQIMYRLNLDDPRLMLPVAVYQLSNDQGGSDYLLRDGVEKAEVWDRVESIPFYAIEPARAGDDLVAVYAQRTSAKRGSATCLSTEPPDPSCEPLFYALRVTDSGQKNPCVISLYEYRDADTGQRLYCTQAQMPKERWGRVEEPLCRVWKAPPGPLLLDGNARAAEDK